MSIKPTNPKDMVGIKKSPLSCMPMRVIFEVGLALFEGARKYGRFNWRVAGVVATVYFDAAQRHLGDWYEGQDIDPYSGVHHISKAIASLVVLRDAMMHGKLTDDRPPPSEEWLDTMNEQAAQIIERYPDAKEPFTRENQDDLVHG